MSEEFEINVLELRERLKEKFGEDEVKIKPTVTVEATTLDDLYFKTIIAALKHGRTYRIDAGSCEGSYRIEFDHAHLFVKNPTIRPLSPTSRPGIPVPTDNEKIEKYFLDYLMNGALETNEHYRYASWIVGMPDSLPLEERNIPRGTRLNQLEWCIEHFVEKGYGTNHCYITVGCAEALKRYDWPYKTESERGTTECLRGIDLKIKDNKLNSTVFFRSWDSVSGLPVNLGGITRLMEYTAGEINERKTKRKKNLPDVEVGSLYANSPGLHVYSDRLDIAELWTGLYKNNSKKI